MKTRTWFVVAVVALMSVVTAHAIDRDAKLVDFARFNWFDVGVGDGWYVDVGGETLLAEVNDEMSVTLGGLYGTASPDGVGDEDFWGVNVGLKYYHSKLTSFTLGVEFMDFLDVDADTRAGTLGIKHRLVSANYDVSPFVFGSVSLRSIDLPWGNYSGDTFTEAQWRVGAGGDLMMSDEMALNVEASYFDAEDITDGGMETPDGWLLSIGLKVYWDDFN